MQGLGVCGEWEAYVGTWRASSWGGGEEVGGGGGCCPHTLPSQEKWEGTPGKGSCPVLFCYFFFQISKVRRQTLSSLSSFGAEKEANALLLSNRVTILNSELILQNPGHNHLIPGRRAKEFLWSLMVVSLVEAQALVTGKCSVYYSTDWVCSNLYLVNRVSLLSSPTAVQP